MRLPLLLILFSTLLVNAQKTRISLDSIKSECSSLEASELCETLGITSNSEANTQLLTFILDWKGTSYLYGGNNKAGVDCSGFSKKLYFDVYKKTIPRVSSIIYENCMPIKKMNLYQGDLVFFATSGTTKVTHMGVYLWDGYFAHASSSKGVMISRLDQGYYKKTFTSGGAWLD